MTQSLRELAARIEALTESQTIVFRFERENGASVTQALETAEKPDVVITRGFVTIQEAVLRNSMGCELDRARMRMHGGDFLITQQIAGWFATLCIGDTITIEERETEI